jgi:hypothetical protein
MTKPPDPSTRRTAEIERLADPGSKSPGGVALLVGAASLLA